MATQAVLDALPVDAHIAEIVEAVRTHRAAVVTAAPGAGKTTRVPPALVSDGRVLLLQPRRVAARSIARRIAYERSWTVGREIGWHVRFDRRDSADTRLLVATEGMLTSRLQQDPLLSEFSTIVIDEFHERSIHADLGLALARQAWLARPDLRLVVMSATLDAARVAAYLGGCPVIRVAGRAFPVDVQYRPGAALEDVVAEEWPTMAGAALCFLPGAGEIRRAADRIAARLGSRDRVFELHGGLDAEIQDAALAPSSTPRIVLATNIAETTLTVPDVRLVIDGGWHKVARYDAERGLDSLEAERIPLDAADQRAGRAGRVAPGRAIRLWDQRDRLNPHREPDVARMDLAAPIMEILVWGGEPRTFEWYDAPAPEALSHALMLLRAIGATDGSGRLTALGTQLRRLPLHPRLARLLLAADAAPAAARACALLSERHFLPASSGATACDLLAAVDQPSSLPPHVLRVAADVRATAAALLGQAARSSIDDETFRRAVLAGYPDRVARRRAPASDRFLLSSGTGARLARSSGVINSEFIVAVDVAAPTSSPNIGSPASEALIRLATAIDQQWLVPTSTEDVHTFDEGTGTVRAWREARYGALVLRASPIKPQDDQRVRLLAEAAGRRGPSEADEQVMRRLTFAGLDARFDDLVRLAAMGAHRLDDISAWAALGHDVRQRLDRDAPADLAVPSGRRAAIVYQDDGRLVSAVKLQELFGLAETPRVGPRKIPVTFELLAPNGRPVQVTSDLRSFWTTGYQQVRKELRARYPKHPWPEDPWTATPTHRTTRRR